MLNERILLRKKKKEEKKGLLLLKDDESFDWEVYETYKGSNVKKGCIVLIDKYCGQEIDFDEEKYLIVKAENITAIID